MKFGYDPLPLNICVQSTDGKILRKTSRFLVWLTRWSIQYCLWKQQSRYIAKKLKEQKYKDLTFAFPSLPWKNNFICLYRIVQHLKRLNMQYIYFAICIDFLLLDHAILLVWITSCYVAIFVFGYDIFPKMKLKRMKKG